MRVKWLRQALLDLDVIETFISKDSPVMARKTILKIIKTVSLLKEQQGLGRAGRVPDTRELVIHQLPYIVPYRVIEEVVQILRVYHTLRKWPDRL